MIIIQNIGVEITSILPDFIIYYAKLFLLGFLSLAILACYLALSAILTRSILGSLMMGICFSVFEPLSVAIFSFLAGIFNKPGLVDLFILTPTYHFENARSWLLADQGFSAIFVNIEANISLGVSLAAFCGWIILLFALTAYLFQKQDISS